MNFTLIGILAATYLLGLPIILRLLFVAHTKLIINKAIERAGKSRAAQKKLPKPLWPPFFERLNFVVKDNRSVQIGKKTLGIQNKQTFLVLWGLGFALFISKAFINSFIVLLIGTLLFFISMIFANFAPKSLLLTRKKIVESMYNIGKARLSISPEYEDNPSQVVKVLEWVDFVKPQKVEYQIPDTFSEDGAEGFLKLFNQKFGQEQTWVPNNDPEEGPGWDFENGKLTIYAVPPLPQIAPWDEHYVLAPGVAWSFFPIALGVEHGLELPNPHTKEIENVLGFDLSGEAPKEAAKHGLKISGNIAVSPMVLVGGGTGGGKSVSVNTLVNTLNKDKNVNNKI